jgi:hypothetical protein
LTYHMILTSNKRLRRQNLSYRALLLDLLLADSQ